MEAAILKKLGSLASHVGCYTCTILDKNVYLRLFNTNLFLEEPLFLLNVRESLYQVSGIVVKHTDHGRSGAWGLKNIITR